jgi:hypothetical protein
MKRNQEELISNESSASDLPPLGAFEELMWLFDLNSPVHFALIAEIEGAISESGLRKALGQLQRRHPLLSSHIAVNENGTPVFRHSPGVEIPLTVIDEPEASWETQVAKEIQDRFDPRRAPLIRAVLMRDGNWSQLILVTHHSIGDALASVFAIRDILKALSGGVLEVLPLQPSRETLYGKPSLAGELRSKPEVEHWLSKPVQPSPTVSSLRLAASLTDKLKEACRQEDTTIHGALCAALVMAGRRLELSWDGSDLRVMSSVSIRRLLHLSDEHMLALGGGEVTVPANETAAFWPLARMLKAGISDVQEEAGVTPLIERANAVVAAGLTVESSSELLKLAFAAQTMVSNLGQLPFDTQFGDFQLRAVWGPAALRGVAGEQTLGAITVHGSLHLVHTSFVPIRGLLRGIRDVIQGSLP